MGYDGLVTCAIAQQLNATLKDGRIDKIYQPESDELIFHIRCGKETHRLYMSANGGHARLHLTQSDHGNPQNPSSFCMLLRKHFQGGRIREIRQIDSERIVEFSIDHINELGFSMNKKLVIEIMGKHSNIIALDLPSGKILDSIKRISLDVNRYRQLLPGLDYVLPPSQGKVSFHTIQEAQLDLILQRNTSSCSETLVAGIQGISPTIAHEICKRALGDSASSYDPENTHQIYAVIVEIVASINARSYTPVVYQGKEDPADFHVFPLTMLADYYEGKVFSDPSQAVEYYYTNKATTNRIRQKSADLYKAVQSGLDKLYLKKQRLSEDLLKAENAEKDRLYGELLTANMHDLHQGLDQISLENYYDGTQIVIPLDSRQSPSENAQRYYKRYNKAKIAKKEKSHQLSEANASIGYLESVMAFVEQADTMEEIEMIRQELIEGGYLRMRKNLFRSSRTKLTPQEFITADGFRILVGRNNKENDVLTFKTADKKDYWFHTKDIPGSHVILVTSGKQPSDSATLAAASLAAYYSKARLSENVPVDFTQVRHVKKTAGAKPGMVIFTDNKTVYVNPSKDLLSTSK